jgi:hypothetical protein
MSTPHRGSESIRWPLLLANIGNVTLPSSYPGAFRADLLRSLEKNSEALQTISTNFRNPMSRIKIISFVEQEVTPPLSQRVCPLLVSLESVFADMITGR